MDSEHVEEVPLESVAVVRKRRPRALWAVLAAVAVAAGALVVTSTDDEGTQRPGLPVDLGAAARASGAEAAADASMPAWIDYVAGDDLPALGGDATAYRLSGDVDEARVRELADALGLDGDLQPGNDEGGSWILSGEGGQGRLDVYSSGGPHWSYSAGPADCSGVGCAIDCTQQLGEPVTCSGSSGSSGAVARPMCEGGVECAEPTTTTYVDPCSAPDGSADCHTACDDSSQCPPSTSVAEPPPDTASDCSEDDCVARCEGTGECPGTAECAEAGPCPDEPSPDLPDEQQARAAALAVVAASGVDVDGARVTADPSSDIWVITVEPEVDGMPSGLMSSVGIGPDLVVIWGSGYLGQPEALGEYPLLDTRAVIDRANARSGIGIEPALGEPEARSAAGGGEAGAEVGGTTGDPDEPITTVVDPVDPCVVPEGASDGCGDVDTATTLPCKVQPDGREICEYDAGCAETGGGTDGGSVTTLACEVLTCPPAVPGEDVAVGAPESPDCTPPPPGVAPIPPPEPQPIEIVLVDAEPSLMLLPATDGSDDAYLVPAYRFTAADGSTVDLAAVADEALSGPNTTGTTVPGTVAPEPEPVPEPQPCEILEEGDASGTTHTVQSCPTPNEDPGVLGEDEEATIGVGYHVNVDTQCAGGSFKLGGEVWVTDNPEVADWADPGERHEGGTFTLDAEDHGTFAGDAARTKVAEFRALGPAEDIFCTPEPRY